jgi:hypothetical protein
MNTMNRLRHIADQVRQRRTSRRLATVSVSGRGFKPIEDDFFAREAELYGPGGSAGDDFEWSDGPAQGHRYRLLVAWAVIVATAVVFLARFQPHVFEVQRLRGLWRAAHKDSAAASTSSPAQTAFPSEIASPTPITPPRAETPKQELAQPQREAAPQPGPAAEAPKSLPRRASKSSAKFAGALSKCRKASSGDHVRRALDACRDAVALQPRSPEALTFLARAELDRHHSHEAQRLATVAISSDPKFSDAYVMMGKAHQQAGQKAQARASYRQYLALAPEGRYAGEVRALLKRGL